MFNKIILIGRLVRDPELRYTPGKGVAVAKFTLAVDRRFKREGQQQADFIDCVVWDKLAENLAQYKVKGDQVAVEGRLEIRSYEDKEGQKRKATEVTCDNVVYLGSKKSEHTDPPAWDESMIGDDDVPF